jgi:hypothetical protein
MKGFIRKAMAGLCLGSGLTLVGCTHYRGMVDPCWPERYNMEARLSVREACATQANNGRVLDQTFWNLHFEADPKTGDPTDKLNAAGMEHLNYLTRRRPVPDPHIYLQTAQNIPGAATLEPGKVAQVRSELDNKRVASIQRYLAGVMSGRSQAVAFDVAIHDPSEVGMVATPITGNAQKGTLVKGAIPNNHESFKGKLAGVDSVTITTTGQ